ncbi:deazaflavin-dependent oxidoreductase, nitroreductase family [Amycolatopsis arida]|uniref:Deazaflavin-dependent oxidoreductase, nitroreductase family n=2 Tax=Amycolatopsis arida TaxID=587909 RepID=A0A1I5QCZ7_9PSEU|nr:deazaflavin-dependent oxidoreductase (nitroreductase family) [Amycolatopsis arida]SFP43850.1 deazaflavin-dependent oxidoreductase, nitroreductase family [Amycolatopsis arida]
MGRDLLILNTVGRRSGQPRETPLAWFADGEDAWLIVASGGGSQHPDWYLITGGTPRPGVDRTAGRDAVPVTSHRLAGADREQAWQRIAAQSGARSTRASPTGNTR